MKGGDAYIHLYIHHTGYEREHKVLQPDIKMAVHKPSLQAKQKTVMAPNKQETNDLIVDGILSSAAASAFIQQTSGAFWRSTRINKMDGCSQSEADWTKAGNLTCLVFSRPIGMRQINPNHMQTEKKKEILTDLQCVRAVTTSYEMLPQQTGNILRECRWANMAERRLFQSFIPYSPL